LKTTELISCFVEINWKKPPPNCAQTESSGYKRDAVVSSTQSFALEIAVMYKMLVQK